MSLSQRWSAQLEALREQGRYRELTPPNGVDFSSNDYLGYAAVTEPCTLSPSGASSRLLRGTHPIWQEVETALADWHGVETTTMFTSGYVANEGLLSTVIEPGDWVASDEFNHASIIDGLRLSRAERFVFRHNDLNHLEDGLRNADRNRGERFVVVESLYSMEGTRSPLPELAKLCERHHAHLIVDEAHATGCFGRRGAGLIDHYSLREAVTASIHTGGKALGVCGAYVCGSRRLHELLVNRCRHFIFTTALPPMIGEWWLSRILKVQADDERRDRLHTAASFFREQLDTHGVSALGDNYIAPIVLGADDEAMAAAEWCQQAGWDVRAVRPPSVPPGSARLRVSIHADHEMETLARLAQDLEHAQSRARSKRVPGSAYFVRGSDFGE